MIHLCTTNGRTYVDPKRILAIQEASPSQKSYRSVVWVEGSLPPLRCAEEIDEVRAALEKFLPKQQWEL